MQAPKGQMLICKQIDTMRGKARHKERLRTESLRYDQPRDGLAVCGSARACLPRMMSFLSIKRRQIFPSKILEMAGLNEPQSDVRVLLYCTSSNTSRGFPGLPLFSLFDLLWSLPSVFHITQSTMLLSGDLLDVGIATYIPGLLDDAAGSPPALYSLRWSIKPSFGGKGRSGQQHCSI
jgi:hypothetical protein